MWWTLHQWSTSPCLCPPTPARHPTSPRHPPMAGLVVAGTPTTTSTMVHRSSTGGVCTRPRSCWCSRWWWWWWCTMVKRMEKSCGDCSGGLLLHLAWHSKAHLAPGLAHLAPPAHPGARLLPWPFPNPGYLSFQTPWRPPLPAPHSMVTASPLAVHTNPRTLAMSPCSYTPLPISALFQPRGNM